MKEFIEKRSVTGSINLTLPGRGTWTADKGEIVAAIKKTVEQYQRQGYKLGDKSWEVDALSPEQLQDIVTNHIEENMDMELYDEVKVREIEEKKQLDKLIESIK